MNIFGKLNNWFVKYVGVIIVGWGILMMFAGIYAFLTTGDCPAQVQAASPTQALVVLQPTEMVPTKQLEDPAPAMVDIQEAEIVTYTYRLDEYGHAIWREAAAVPPGTLMKLGPCWEDGFRQVEYRDPVRPNRWNVEYMKCIN